VVADAPCSRAYTAEWQRESATAGIARRGGLWALATGASAAVRVVVVAQAEEPDEPDDQEPHVQDAETDHEDPALGAHPSPWMVEHTINRDGTARGKEPQGRLSGGL
jgi:hypothetical protein